MRFLQGCACERVGDYFCGRVAETRGTDISCELMRLFFKIGSSVNCMIDCLPRHQRTTTVAPHFLTSQISHITTKRGLRCYCSWSYARIEAAVELNWTRASLRDVRSAAVCGTVTWCARVRIGRDTRGQIDCVPLPTLAYSLPSYLFHQNHHHIIIYVGNEDDWALGGRFSVHE